MDRLTDREAGRQAVVKRSIDTLPHPDAMSELLQELSTTGSSEVTDSKTQGGRVERKRSQLRGVSPETQATTHLAHIRLNSTSRAVKKQKNRIEGKVSLHRLRMRTLLESYAVALANRLTGRNMRGGMAVKCTRLGTTYLPNHSHT